MCDPVTLAAIGLGGGAATAAGATAAAATGAAAAGAATGAATLATTVATAGSIISAGGMVLQGIQGARAAEMQIAALETQKATEAQLNAQQDRAERAKFTTAIRQQRAELAARGVQLDSVTAMALGQSAAKEMAFQSQAIRSGGQATQTELTSQQRQARAMKASAVLNGTFGAAGTVLKDAPDLWPGFFADKTGAK